MRRTIRIGAAIALLTAAVAALTGCTAANPADVIWTLAAKGPVVAVDSTTGVYVSGRMRFGSGDIDSKGVIDYQYARKLSTGGIRQDLVSTTYERIAGGDYPGPDVVTIFQDAKPDGSNARIEIFECDPGSFHYCVMPDGARMRMEYYRVDIHVPPGSVVDSYGDGANPSGGASTVPSPTPTTSTAE